MKPIYGNDCVVKIKVSGFYYPLLCATSFQVGVSQLTREATTVGTGTWRQHRTIGLSGYTVSLSGLTKIDNTDGQISWFHVFQESVRGAEQQIEISFIDPEGNTQYLYCTVLIPDMSIDVSVSDFANGSIEFLGTGDPQLVSNESMESISSVLCEVQPTLTGTLDEGETDVVFTELTNTGAQVLWVSREGIGYRPTTGTPGNREFVVNYSTGTITFQYQGNPGGEGIEVGWQIVP